jgi:Ca2+-binding RTX toxin-like protein
MATSGITQTIAVTNPYLAGLLPDFNSSVAGHQVHRWSTASPITYYLLPGDANANGTDDREEFGAVQAFSRAFAQFSAVANVAFQQVGSASEANFIEGFNYFPGSLDRASHDYPSIGTPAQSTGTYNIGHQHWVNSANNAQGSQSYTTILHEIGHGLGLEHPFDNADFDTFPGATDFSAPGTNGLSQRIWTVMAFLSGWNGDEGDPLTYGGAGSPMAFDIAALQLLYGANTTTATGNDLYTLPSTNAIGTSYICIWDAGGVDTIRANPMATTGVLINLNDATLLNAPGGGGFVSRQTGILGGYTIANGVRIENATGGNGNDTLIGNEFANLLSGGNGNDTLDGGTGTDTLNGGAGNDHYMQGSDATDIISDTSGLDTVFTTVSRNMTGYAGVENLFLQGSGNINGTGNALFNGILGNSGNNVLAGQDGNDALEGGGGNDFLFGQGGQDSLVGGAGNDTFSYQTAAQSIAGPTCDYIRDFDDLGNDRIDLAGVFGGTLTYVGTNAFTGANQVRLHDVAGPNLVVAVNLDADTPPEMQILLLGTTLAQMGADDFLL